MKEERKRLLDASYDGGTMSKITINSFGTEKAQLYTLTNGQGMQVCLTNFGARIVNILLPVDGQMRNVSLATDSDTDYLEKDAYVGSSLAPVAGRISGAATDIKGETVHFTENEPGRTLHSGNDTSIVQYWDARVDEDANQVIFSLLIPDGYNGFPGAVNIQAIYQLTEENELKIDYLATSEKDTIFNPTNHVYFNLSGDFSTSVADHQVKIEADQFVPLGEDNMPLGEFWSVEGTAFDFREFAPLGQGLNGTDPQIQLVNGYDHPWALKDVDIPVQVISPDEKVRLVMRSNQPAVVIYTYNHGPTDMAGRHTVFSLECQGFPNACNIEKFGSILLEKGQEYHSHFSYQFLF